MADNVYLAVDLGASSGRVVAGRFDGSELTLEEVHRFENGGVRGGERLYWDLLNQWSQVQQGLRKAADQYGQVASVGVDTWGVDFALLDKNDELISNPVHYRDSRTSNMMEGALQAVSRETIFAETGLQFMEFNTLYQLLALKQQASPQLDIAQTFLMIPDLFHWLLTGRKSNEFTNASTTQFLNPQSGGWSQKLFDAFGLPSHILQTIEPPGTSLGLMRASLQESTGLTGAKVVLPGTHDTASAVMAVPAAGEFGTAPDWCYISSGTWSLMGVEIPTPVVTSRCQELNFTNEGGVGGTVRLLKNIAGLWLVQQCRSTWNHGGARLDWAELVEAATNAPACQSVINPDHLSFTAPDDMPAAIQAFCAKTSQPVPTEQGAIIRCVLESLALRYRMVLNALEELSGQRLATIHIVGGGAQNRLLCQMAADACQRRVVAGPVEATAIGNLAVQAVADGAIGSLSEAREVIRGSFAVEEFIPRQNADWDSAFARFESVIKS